MTLPAHTTIAGLSGERFAVDYLLTGYSDDAEALTTARAICIEQTVEFPQHRLPAGDIPEHIVGRIESFSSQADGQFAVTISYAVETAGDDLLQLLNIILGLSSLLPGVHVRSVGLPASLLERFPGPRFGIEGIRALSGVSDRALLCTALKPMGLSVQDLADMAYRCALGGLDILKDDHGLTNQSFCPFEERVSRCVEAVARANRETGRNCLYVANVTAPTSIAVERARFARQAGAGAIMVSPALTGFDLVTTLAGDRSIGLPIVLHPTLAGGFLAGRTGSGFSYYFYHGQLPRLAGADISVFTNYGGRFPVERDDSLGAVAGCVDPMGNLKRVFPMVGGGMQLERIRVLCDEFGRDVILLMGGGLHTAGDDLVENVRQFVQQAM